MNNLFLATKHKGIITQITVGYEKIGTSYWYEITSLMVSQQGAAVAIVGCSRQLTPHRLYITWYTK